MPLKTARVRAFSLIELMVVIGIITLLMSLMLPALKRSLRQAATTVCKHNLRALDQVMQMYRMESKGWLPHTAGTGGDDEPAAPWFDALVPSYLADLSVLICPEDPYRVVLEQASHSLSNPGWEHASSYGMSELILSSPNSYLAHLDRNPPRRPLDTLLLADLGPDTGAPDFLGPGGRLTLDRNQGRVPWSDGFDCGQVASPRAWLTRRHGDSINVLTVGGEVRSIRTADLMDQTILEYYSYCAAGDCTFCLELGVPHYSFAHARTFWWTGPLPKP